MSLILFFEKLNKISLFLLLFLVPIFFLPFTQNFLDFPKQNLALLLILLSTIGWLGKNIFERNFTLRENKIFYLLVFLIFLSLLLSSIFSISKKISFFGYFLRATDSFLIFLLFLLLAFLIINSFQKEEDFFPYLLFFLFSGAIACLLNIFQMYKIFILPFDFTKSVSFNTIGTTNTLAILAAVFLPISLILIFRLKSFLKIILAIISLVFLSSLILINFRTAWIVFIIGILLLFIFALGKPKEKIKIGLAISLMLNLIISIFFYFFPLRPSSFPILPPEVSLTFNSEVYILKKAFSANIKNIILGTGPGTFIFDYSQYRSPLLNRTIFWGTRFASGNSSFLDWFLTRGFFGALSLLALYSFLIFFLFKQLRKAEENEIFFEIKLGLASGILGLIVASFLYPFNFLLYFVFWLFLAGFLLFSNQKLREIKISSSLKTVLTTLIFLGITISSVILFAFQSRGYFAEIKYLSGIKAAKENDINRAINEIEAAVLLNPYLDIYWRDLAQLYLLRARLILEDPNLSPEEKSKLASQAIITGRARIERAVQTEPNNVANWNVRGFFYRNLIGIEKASEIAVSSYQKSTQLEPTSPFAFGEMGRVYILAAENFAEKGEKELQRKNLELAIDSLKKSIELKPDYATAHYLLAIAYDQKGETEEAIATLETTKKIMPEDAGIAFQLGLLYWRKENLAKAEEAFQKALELNPEYYHAHYMLGLIYNKKGENEKAKEEFKIVAQANPENQQIKQILENLEKGLPVTQGISLPLIQETPSEIQK